MACRTSPRTTSGVPHAPTSPRSADPHVAERCLNHKLKGVEGIYNRHDYFAERKAALEGWGQLLE